MADILQVMGENHRHCDEFFLAAEQAAQRGDMAACRARLAQFAAELEQHLSLEEQSLFPRFESATGMTAGPTAVMRMEHGQMRQLVEEMQAFAGNGDAAGFLASADTLLILMQQHNLKEENVLYPMLDRVLAGERDTLLAPIVSVKEPA